MLPHSSMTNVSIALLGVLFRTKRETERERESMGCLGVCAVCSSCQSHLTGCNLLHCIALRSVCSFLFCSGLSMNPTIGLLHLVYDVPSAVVSVLIGIPSICRIASIASVAGTSVEFVL